MMDFGVILWLLVITVIGITLLVGYAVEKIQEGK